MYGYYVSNNIDALYIIDYLVENCYIDSSNMISEYEDITFFQYCEVCGLYRPDWFKAYCYYRYNNNNNNDDNGCISSDSSHQSISSRGKLQDCKLRA